MRGLLMLLLTIGLTVGQWLSNLLALVQFPSACAPRNEFLAGFGSSLTIRPADAGDRNIQLTVWSSR
jgi:hypothetical protein